MKGVNYTKPALYHYDYDLSKKWFVAFRYFDQSTETWKQFQFRGDINKYSKKKDRLAEGNALRDAIYEMLLDDWNPFTGYKSKNVQLVESGTLVETIAYLIEIRKGSIKKESTRTYVDVQKVFERWLKSEGLKNIRPAQFTPVHARRYLDNRLASGYGPSTYNKHLSMLITFFNLMIDRKIVKENPFKGIRQLRKDIGKNIAFSVDERAKLANLIASDNPQLYLFIQLMFYCFLRRTEILSLKVKDINTDQRTITVQSGSAKNRRQDSVSIPPAFNVYLKSLNLSQYNQDYYLFSRLFLPGPVQRKKADHITTIHKQYLKQLKIDQRKTLYSWKHSGVIALYLEILDAYSVMRQLRHHDLQTTMIYLKSLGLTGNKPVLQADIHI